MGYMYIKENQDELLKLIEKIQNEIASKIFTKRDSKLYFNLKLKCSPTLIT